jgi:ABC-2 type transport system ATP-binding protein
LNDYMNKERTILVTTHQVEEIENILTDVLFIEHGRIVLDAEMETLGQRFTQLVPAAGNVDKARALKPFWEREIFGRSTMLFEGRSTAELAALGETRAPSVADLFVAKMQPIGGMANSKEAA